MTNVQHLFDLLAGDCIKEFKTANIHSVLDVPTNSSLETIRSSIRSYLRTNHPDKAGSSATARTQVMIRFNSYFTNPCSILTYIFLPKASKYYFSPPDDSQEHLSKIKLLEETIKKSKEETVRMRKKLKMMKSLLDSKEETLAAIKLDLREKLEELEKKKEECSSLELQIGEQKITIDQMSQDFTMMEIEWDEQVEARNRSVDEILANLRNEVAELKKILNQEEMSHLETKKQLQVKENALKSSNYKFFETTQELEKEKEKLKFAQSQIKLYQDKLNENELDSNQEIRFRKPLAPRNYSSSFSYVK